MAAPLPVVYEPPPMFETMLVHFPQIPRMRPIFCSGEKIYNPYRIKVTPSLQAHEQVHSFRQLSYPDTSTQTGPELWWSRYLTDVEFRLEEELPAHCAEYGWYIVHHNNRRNRRRALAAIAGKLAHPLYGVCIPKRKVMEMIKQNARAVEA